MRMFVMFVFVKFIAHVYADLILGILETYDSKVTNEY